MAAGRRRNSKSKNQLVGQTRPCRNKGLETVVEFPIASKVPTSPDWLNEEGKKLWKEVAPVLFAQKILTQADVYALTHLCNLHGVTIDGYKRRVQPTAADLAQLRLYFAEFGMTPSSRSKVTASGGKEKNKFGKNGKANKANKAKTKAKT